MNSITISIHLHLTVSRSGWRTVELRRWEQMWRWSLVEYLCQMVSSSSSSNGNRIVGETAQNCNKIRHLSFPANSFAVCSFFLVDSESDGGSRWKTRFHSHTTERVIIIILKGKKVDILLLVHCIYYTGNAKSSLLDTIINWDHFLGLVLGLVDGYFGRLSTLAYWPRHDQKRRRRKVIWLNCQHEFNVL